MRLILSSVERDCSSTVNTGMPWKLARFCLVPAGQIHRLLEDFSSDFTVWVAFYGPEGGEAG